MAVLVLGRTGEGEVEGVVGGLSTGPVVCCGRVQSKSSGVRGGSRAMSRDGGHGKGVGPGGWGGAFMIAEVSYARSWGLREGSCPRRFEAVAVGLGGVRGGVWGARVGWGWV